MRKFDGVLLCTDFDMTLGLRERISPENMEAIRYFKENGGLFTIVSGRNPRFLLEHQAEFCIDMPFAGYNGALIFDPVAGKYLYEGGRKDQAALEFVRPFWERDPRIRRMSVHIRAEEMPRCTRTAEPSGIDALKRICPPPLYNVVCISGEEDSEAVREELCEAARGTDFVVVRSWERGTEIVCRGDEKGDAARRLAEMCHARLLVTAGDFENDISMLRAADIGYAVANALPNVKAAADRVTVACKDHAIAAIIRELEEKDI